VTAAARSRVMAAIRRRDTGPELAVRRLARRMGARFRVDAAGLPGRPDLASRAGRWAVFVNGCFWHDHACRRGRRPRTRAAFWADKLDRNLLRDASSADALQRAGWRVLTIWECDVRNGRAAAALARFLGG
jgi:DNA mismatch endonuclease (patch repair protein)